jgi:hypothetical protein
MIKVSDVYPSPWIAPEEITRPFTVTIRSVAVEEFRRPDGSKEHKIVLSFLRAQKRLPLNKTQAKALAQLLGDDAEQWAGSTIVLAPATAPNRKPTIAVGVPHAPASATGGTPSEPPAEAQPTPCEICGQTDGHAEGCPDA